MAAGGFPDWSRLPVQTGNLVAGFGVSKAVTTTTNRIDTLGYEYLNVSINDFANPGAFYIQFQWYNDYALTIQIAIQAFTPVTAGTESFQIPTLGRWLVMVFTPIGSGNAGITNYFMFGSSAQSPALYADKYAAPVVYVDSSFAAGITGTIPLGQMHGGRVHYSVNCDNSNKWTSWIEYFDYFDGVWLQFWTAHGGDHGLSYETDLLLPYAPVRINMRNDDTVAHTEIISMMIS